MNPQPAKLTSRFEDALVYASRLHRDQRRKGAGAPYVSHLLAVAALVLEHGGGEDEAIAALLHDAVEDQGGAETREEIRKRFGEGVASIVDGCTDTDQEPKPPWRQRKQAFIERIASQPESVRLVVAADKLHNIRSTLRELEARGDVFWENFRGGRDGSLWYYRSMVDALRLRDGGALVDELERAVRALERAAR